MEGLNLDKDKEEIKRHKMEFVILWQQIYGMGGNNYEPSEVRILRERLEQNDCTLEEAKEAHRKIIEMESVKNATY
jgi:hypothetical protein